MPRRRAFTLIELAGVLALSALLAGGATMMLSSSRRQVEFDDAIGQLIHADSTIRDIARLDHDIQMSFDAVGKKIYRTDTSTGGLSIVAEFTGRLRIEQVIIAGERLPNGEARVSYSAGGLSSTYAILISAPGGRHQWVAFLGLSGQSMRLKDEDVATMFETASRVGTH